MFTENGRKTRSVAEVYPHLLTEWAAENSMNPEDVSFGSSKSIIWKGACGHTWNATVKNRGNGSGCPFCVGNRVLPGFNDLVSGYSYATEEWSEKNLPLRPEEVTRHSSRSVWWRCHVCGHEWKARIADRVDGSGCPVCTGHQFKKGVNDFQTEHPRLAEEWADENEKKPYEVWSKSRENILWKCRECGYQWSAVIDSRVKGEAGCPSCRKKESAKKQSKRTCSCGRFIRGKIADGVSEPKCAICKAKEDYRLRLGAVAYYVQKKGYTPVFGSDEIIGIPLALYVPELRLAVETTPPSKRLDKGYRWENPKNWLCLNAGINLYRIILPGDRLYDNCLCLRIRRGSRRSLERAVREIVRSAGISSSVNLKRDREEVLKMIENEKKNEKALR